MIGLHRFDADTYHRDPCPEPSLSSTLARLILDHSPLHAWTACERLNPDWEPTERKTFDIGRAAHRLVLGAGADFEVIPPEMLGSNGAASTKEARAFIEECRARGVTPIKEAEADAVRDMAAAAESQLNAMGIHFDDSQRAEIAAIARIDGVWCRAMVDYAPKDSALPLYDFKTTTDASHDAVKRSIAGYGYALQAAHYVETWKAATGEDRLFRLCFVEKTVPYGVSVVEIGCETLATAARMTRRAREMWATCLRTEQWPGYPPMVIGLDLDPWWHERWLNRESAEDQYRQTYGHDIIEAATRWQSPDTFQPKETP